MSLKKDNEDMAKLAFGILNEDCGHCAEDHDKEEGEEEGEGTRIDLLQVADGLEAISKNIQLLLNKAKKLLEQSAKSSASFAIVQNGIKYEDGAAILDGAEIHWLSDIAEALGIKRAGRAGSYDTLQDSVRRLKALSNYNSEDQEEDAEEMKIQSGFHGDDIVVGARVTFNEDDPSNILSGTVIYDGYLFEYVDIEGDDGKIYYAIPLEDVNLASEDQEDPASQVNPANPHGGPSVSSSDGKGQV